MRQENSVLFALRDLRSLESDRVAEEERAQEELRRQAEEERRAHEQQRIADEERERQASAQRGRERQERESLALALRDASGRNEQLESDMRQLRALVSAVAPVPERRRLWPIGLVALVGALFAVAMVAQRASVRERIVYLPVAAPVSAPPPPAPSATVVAPPAPKPEPPRAQRVKTPPKKRIAKPDSKLPAIDDCGGKDPLCGTGL
jgi:hypothetical protein